MSLVRLLAETAASPAVSGAVTVSATVIYVGLGSMLSLIGALFGLIRHGYETQAELLRDQKREELKAKDEAIADRDKRIQRYEFREDEREKQADRTQSALELSVAVSAKQQETIEAGRRMTEQRLSDIDSRLDEIKKTATRRAGGTP